MTLHLLLKEKGGEMGRPGEHHTSDNAALHTPFFFHILRQGGVNGSILQRQPEHSKCYEACEPGTSGRLHPE